jgi:hypothetical protein
MTQEEAYELLDKYENELKKIFPTFEFGVSGLSSVGGIVKSQHYEFLICQNSLTNTPYDPQNQKLFVHYTSLDALYGILNSGEFRLYDLNNMNDPYELNYLIKILDLEVDQDQVENFKRSLFVTSLCAYSDIEKDNFDLWRLYGRNGQGVAIVFEITNSQNNWIDFLLGKVYYGLKNGFSKSLEQAIKLTNEFVRNYHLKLKALPKIIGFLLAHHKNDIWEIEKEYRLSTFIEYDSYDMQLVPSLKILENNLSFFLDGNGKRLAYYNFPLDFKLKINSPEYYKASEESNSMLEKIPQIKINKIITGYSLGEKLTKELSEFVFRLSVHKWNSYIEVQESHLNSWFK